MRKSVSVEVLCGTQPTGNFCSSYSTSISETTTASRKLLVSIFLLFLLKVRKFEIQDSTLEYKIILLYNYICTSVPILREQF